MEEREGWEANGRALIFGLRPWGHYGGWAEWGEVEEAREVKVSKCVCICKRQCRRCHCNWVLAVGTPGFEEEEWEGEEGEGEGFGDGRRG